MLRRPANPWTPTAAACALLFVLATPVKLVKFVASARAAAAQPADAAHPPKKPPIAVAATLPTLAEPRRDHEQVRRVVRSSDDLPDDSRQSRSEFCAFAPVVRSQARFSRPASAPAPCDAFALRDQRRCGRDQQPTGPPPV